MSLNPVDWATDSASGAASDVVRATAESVVSTLADAVHTLVDEMLGFLNKSSTVNLDSGWWKGEQASGILQSVGTIALALMLAFLLMAIIQGLLAGDVGGMLRAALVEVPLSVVGISAVVAGAGLLLKITDEASATVLGSAPESLGKFFTTWANADPGNLAIAFLMLGVAVIAAFLIWVELLVRSSLLYFLIALAPLAFAARVWPSTRTIWKKLCEVGVALILSKFAIALSLGLGAAALAGGPADQGNIGEQVGTALNGQLIGVALLGVSCFTPFVLLKLLPVVEGALVAQGISRSPARGVQSAMQAAYYAHGLSRLAGGASRAAKGAGARGPARATSSSNFASDHGGGEDSTAALGWNRPFGELGPGGGDGADVPRGGGPLPSGPTPRALPLPASEGARRVVVPAALVYLHAAQPPVRRAIPLPSGGSPRD